MHNEPRRMVYDQEEQAAIVKQIIVKARSEFDNEYDEFAWTMELEDVFNLKNPHFASEREWRVIWRNSASNLLCDNERPVHGSGRPIHYVKLPLCDWEFVEIICGPRALQLSGYHRLRDCVNQLLGELPEIPIEQSHIRLWR